MTKLESGKIQMDTSNVIKIGKFPNKESEESLGIKKNNGCCP